MNVKTPRVVPIGMDRQFTPAMTRLKVRERRWWRRRPETIVRMPVLQPNSTKHDPNATKNHPRNGGGGTGCPTTGTVVGELPGGTGGANNFGPFSNAIPITMCTMKIDENRIVIDPHT